MKRKKKLILFLTFLFLAIHLSAQGVDKRFSITFKNESLSSALKKIGKVSGVRVEFAYEDVNPYKVTANLKDVTAQQAVKAVINGKPLTYSTNGRFIVISKVNRMIAPQKSNQSSSRKHNITGQVLDAEGEPLIGVTVKIKGTTMGVLTDVNGKFDVSVNNDNSTLVFSYIGKKNIERRAENGNYMKIVLEDVVNALDNVVVTGYQTISKERATGSYSIVSQKNLKGKLETNIMSRIEGLIPGINKVSSNGSNSDIVIRGITTYRGVTSPLYVVDGMPYEGSLSSIVPSDVQNITVLKDAAASSIYGARAANGVIVITTRRGKEGKTRVAYDGSIKITPKSDLGYLNLMNSSELIDLQIEGFNYYHTKYENLNKRYSLNPVLDLLYKHEKGQLNDSSLSDALLPYRNMDNRGQIEKEFERVGVTHQHNLSISGGTERNRYIASLNYTGDFGNQKFQYSDRIGFNLKDDVTFYKWLSADFGVTGAFSRSDSDNGGSSYMSLIRSYPSYYMLRDENGMPKAFPRNKSDYELNRLQSIGLLDETYSPITNRSEENYHTNSNYYRLYAGLKFNIIEGLNFDVKYQTEGSYNKSRQLYTNRSWYARNMTNDAAVIDPATGSITFNVPKGGQMGLSRSDTYSYTLRAQANFDRIFGKHAITAIAGAERRAVRTTGTNVYYMGYDDNSLNYTPYNPLILSPISGTESLNGSFNWYSQNYNNESYSEDRYVSFFGNASYTFDDRYTLTGSIRMDQSNLFGTDPKYQYRPLWSIGGSWHLTSESFMKDVRFLDRLSVRLTYGIGGNVPKDVGPYLNIYDDGYNSWVGAMGSYIGYPPNPMLRWEKTATTNIGIDFSIFKSRLSGSIDYYNKSTTDLLGSRNADPTLGWSSLLLNYGKMYNRGIEISLQSQNIKNRTFSWTTNATFSYNKNELTNLEGTQESVFNYSAYNVAAVGYPLNSLFSYRYAGLDPKDGNVLVYNQAGEKVSNVSSIKDMVYSGTRTPKYTAALKNAISYQNFDFSFMFVYYGGNVMRDVVAGYMGGAPGSNLNRKAMNHWRKPGDENIPGVAPSFNKNINYRLAQTWYSADVHVKKADYIKLRDVSISYNVPKKYLNKWGFESLALTCQLSNVWWWAANGDIDPESYTLSGYGSGALTEKSPVTYTFGLSVNF